MRRNRKIADQAMGIVAGHSVLTPGVVVRRGPGRRSLREQELCREICDELGAVLDADGVAVFDPRTDTSPLDYPAYLLERIDAMNDAQVRGAVELHLNASSEPGVDYVLCLHAPGSEPGWRLAAAIAGELATAEASATGYRPDVVVEPDTWLGAGQSKAFLRRTRMPAVIVEPAFLTSTRLRRGIDRDRAGWIDRLARACAKGISAWWRS